MQEGPPRPDLQDFTTLSANVLTNAISEGFAARPFVAHIALPQTMMVKRLTASLPCLDGPFILRPPKFHRAANQPPASNVTVIAVLRWKTRRRVPSCFLITNRERSRQAPRAAACCPLSTLRLANATAVSRRQHQQPAQPLLGGSGFTAAKASTFGEDRENRHRRLLENLS
jgi:hypothetical protein